MSLNSEFEEYLELKGWNNHGVSLNSIFYDIILDGQFELAKYFYEKKPHVDIDIFEASFRAACSRGYIEIIKFLLETKPEINISEDNEKAFLLACQYNQFETVKYLLEIKPDINISILEEEAFKIASSKGYLNILKLLIEKKPDIDISIEYNFGLYHSIINGHVEVVKYLFHIKKEYVCDTLGVFGPDKKIIKKIIMNPINVFEFNLDECFKKLCMKGELDMIKYLLDMCINIERDTLKKEALIVACEYGQIEVFKFLFEYNSDIEIEVEYHMFFRESCCGGNLDLVKYLLGIDSIKNFTHPNFICTIKNFTEDEDDFISNDSTTDTLKYIFWTYYDALRNTCQEGYLHIVKYLFDIINEDIYKLFSPDKFLILFQESCKSNNINLVKYIFEKCPNIDISLNDETAFFNAAMRSQSKNFEIINYLLEKKPDIDFLVNDQLLFIGLFKNIHNKYHTIKYLMELRPNLNYDYQNYFKISVDFGYLDLIKFLLEKKPDIDISFDNEYAFRTSCMNNDLDIVKYLLEKKPDINIGVYGNESFFDICMNYDRGSEKSEEIIQLLLTMKPDIINCITNSREIDIDLKNFLNNLGFNLPINWLDVIEYSNNPIGCPICFNEMNEYIETPCKHKFCSECIESWININNICPYCRTRI